MQRNETKKRVSDGQTGVDQMASQATQKILYLHGFASSGLSGTVDLLRAAFGDGVAVVAPDLPVDPLDALPLIRKIVETERPDLAIGTSMGGLYAQMLHGVTRVCVNPSFALSEKTDILYLGEHRWFNRRRDGATTFWVTQETVDHFAEMERHQFEGCCEEDRTKCHALFGDEDTIGLPFRDVFESRYPGMSHLFHGGHRMNAAVVRHVLIPFIREKGLVR